MIPSFVIILALSGTLNCVQSLIRTGRSVIETVVPFEANAWAFQSTLGAGGYGEVHLLQHRKKPDVLRAFKVPHSPEAELDIRKEYDSHVRLERLRIPRLVRFYGSRRLVISENSKRRWGLMLEYINGESMNKKLIEFVNRDINFVTFENDRAQFLIRYLGYLVQAFDFLEVLHRYGLVAIDLSPPNLMVQNNELFFIDPAQVTNLKKLQLEMASNDSFSILASPTFASQDDLHDGTIDFNYDFFSLGMIAFQALALSLNNQIIADKFENLGKEQAGRAVVLELLDSIDFFRDAELSQATKDTLRLFLAPSRSRVSSTENARAHFKDLIQKIAAYNFQEEALRNSWQRARLARAAAGTTVKLLVR